MSETRKVIGVFDSLVVKKDGIGFPSVRVWIRGANDYETRQLERHFPDRGTIFLHVSACENKHPERNQVGLFNCVESPGQTAKWAVDTTSRYLAKVIDCPVWDTKPDHLAFWEWHIGYKDTGPCNILLSQGIVYVRRGKRGGLVGPFGISQEGKLITRDHTYLHEGIEAFSVEIAGRRYEFVDTELLPKGKQIVADPKEAIQRRLKLVSRTGGVDWLSRNKIQELSAALANVAGADGSEWVMENLPHALDLLSSTGNLDAKVAEAILQIKAVEDALEIAWKKRHTDVVKNAKSEIEGLKSAATGIKKSNEGLNKELVMVQKEKVSLEGVLVELNKQIDAAKVDAQKVFEAELKRLAQSPASLAILAAWSNGGNKPADRSWPLIKIQRSGSERQQAADLKSALFNNLKICGLSPTVAMELTAVCRAALAAGQPISFTSLFADLLAEAVASALGQPAMVWADVSAGLLDPVDWDSLILGDHKECPIILQNANRSDIPLVLGTMRPAVLRQAIGHQKPDRVVLLTMVANTQMLVPSEFTFGPLIDERLLRFNLSKATVKLTTCTDLAKQLPDVAAVSAEEFAEIGDSLRRLPLFALSAQESIFRRACGALQGVCENPQDVTRLFFKYWCLPRCLPEDVKTVLEDHKESWGQDKHLLELREALDRNG